MRRINRRPWFLAKAVVGAASLVTLIALASVYRGGESGSMGAQKQTTIVHAKAR